MNVPTTKQELLAPAPGAGAPETVAVLTEDRGRGSRRTFWSQLLASLAMFGNPKSATGLIILGAFVLVAVFAPWIAPYPPTAQHLDQTLEAPSLQHLLGTTHIGEDVFSQLVYGTRGVLLVGFLATIMATVVAIVVGVTAGYLRGWKSEALSALANVFLVLPALPLIIIVASQFQDPPLWIIAAVLGLTGWAWGARVLRAQTMSLRNRDFIQAARANGEPLHRIILVEMLPNLMAIIASSFVGTMTAAVLGLTTLAFIGVIPVSNLNWGTILFWAQQNNAFPDYWWWYVPAGLCIALLGVALSLINFGIDEYVNPRLRSAGERARALKKRGIDQNAAVTAVRPAALPVSSPAAGAAAEPESTTTA
ncbi:ABC transporter permease [Microbacterium azadirachtae]|uniref:Dipeptide transport system permease protein DppC n=1 Tax=Microbacterium azadirachtae TaxID=582680 RepID=A0A0F0LJW7_9MICO|nr:Dipeptide transport system permease protein DppC [Microbacterium azadirachtae]